MADRENPRHFPGESCGGGGIWREVCESSRTRVTLNLLEAERLLLVGGPCRQPAALRRSSQLPLPGRLLFRMTWFTRPILITLSAALLASSAGSDVMAKDPPGVVSLFSTPDGSGVTQMAISPDQTVLLGSAQGTVWQWTPRKSRVAELFPTPPQHAPVSNLGFDNAGNLFLRRGTELVIQTTDGKRKTVRLPILPHLEVSPTGRQLAAMGEEPPIVFFDPFTGERMHRVDRQVLVDEIRYAPDGRRVVTYRFGRLYVWDSETGELVRKIRLEVNVLGLIFSPDSQRLFAAVEDEGVWVIDISTGDILERLRRSHPIQIDPARRSRNGNPPRHRFAVSPDGTLLAETRPDKHIEIWETFTGRPVLLLEQHPGEITDLQFLQGGLHLVSGDDQGHAYLWDLTASEFAGTFDVSPPYSPEELAKMWRMLGEFHGHASWSAMVALKHRPLQALPLLENPPDDDLLIQQLIERLDDDRFSVRQAAYRTLKQLSLAPSRFCKERSTPLRPPS